MEYDPDKGQHFLVDDDVLELEIETAALIKKDKVIEIGAGKGILTRELVKRAGEVLAFEIDERFLNELKEIKKAKVIMGNALSYDWRNYNKIVSNISYSLSEPVIMKAIWDGIEELTLIIGENFKELICSEESKIGIITNLVYKVKPISKVDRSSFNPSPKVNSWLVKLFLKKGSKIENLLKKIIFRNGKIKNSIIYSLVEEGFTKKESKEILEKMNLEETTLEKPVASITGKFILILMEKLEGFL
jgi:16S rRNA (adenine1518-N6/adenine1519-N6)-dimethyltransferase